MGETLALTSNSLRRLFGRPRFYAALLLTVGSLFMLYGKVPAYLREHDLAVQAAEPFLLAVSCRLSQLLLVLSFLLLLGDAPFFHEGMEIVFVRTSKRRWLAAQVLTVFAMTALWLFFAFAVSVLIFLPRVSFENAWSFFLKIAARLGYGAEMGLRGVDVDSRMLQNGTPWGLLAVGYLYSLLLFGYCGVWAILLNLWTKRSYGSLLLVSFCALRLALASLFFSPAVERISPMNLADVKARSLAFGTVADTVLFFTIQTVLLWFLSRQRLRRLDLLGR